MISTIFNGTPVYLLPYVHDWTQPVDATFEVQARTISGRSNREEREPMGRELLTTIKFSSLLSAAEATALREIMAAWDNRPVLCPFWPAMTTLLKSSSVVGAIKVWFEPDFSRWEVGTGVGPVTFAPSGACRVAPVMWGRFVQFPQIVTLNGAGDHAATFEVVERGPAEYALQPREIELTTAVVNTQTVPMLTVPFSWGDNSSVADVRIKRQKIGFGRDEAEDYVPQLARTKQTMQFSALDGTELRYLLTLFKNRFGSVKPWRCPKVHNAAELELGRFYGDALRVAWETSAVGEETANCKIEFLSLPTESLALVDETPGVTIGGKPGRWFGYVVTDGYSTWRLTSFESAIEGPGGTFEPRNINHGTITEEINLQLNDCRLQVENWPGSPFTRLRNQPAAPALTVQIYEGLVANPAAAQLIFTGRAQAPEGDGAVWTISLTGLSDSLLSMKGPKSVMQQTCIAVFGDRWCKANVAAFAVNMSLVRTVAGVSEFTSGAPTTLPDHRFAAGCAKRTVGGTVQRYLIVDSYKLANGNLACVLSGSITPPPTDGELAWTLEPGCPGTEAACKGFNNFVNMRAAPRMPKANPAMVVVKSSSGGKKG